MTHTMITVDGSTSTDLDDGFSIAETKDGWELLIHIATPALKLPYSSNVVKKAESRAVTQYSGKNIRQAMLDDDAVNDACSLLPGTKHNTLCVNLHVSKDGGFNLQNVALCEGVENVAKLDYVGFGQVLKDDGSPLFNQAKWSTACARALFYKRVDTHGGLAFIDEETGSFTDEEGNVKVVSLREIHAQIVVQEFMIMSNVALTQWAIDNKLPIIYRNHEPLDVESFKESQPEMYKTYQTLDYDALSKMKRSFFKPAMFGMTNKGHAGLGVPAYGTFSSPLRRFPDLFNSYVVLGFLQGNEIPTFNDARCENINQTIATMKKSRSESMKDAAGHVAYQAFKKTGELTPNQFTQVIKRHPGRGPRIAAVAHMVKNDKLHFSTQVWSVLITHPLKLPKALAKEVMALFTSIKMGKAIHFHICHTLGFHHPDIDAEDFDEKAFLALFSDAIGIPIKKGNQDKESGDGASKGNERANMGVAVKNVEKHASNDNFVPGVNYKGEVYEICQKAGLTPPKVSFANKGADHFPVWEATLLYSWAGVNGSIVDSDVVKKTAEAKVFCSLKAIMASRALQDVVSPNGNKHSSSSSNVNPKSALFEWCQAHKVPVPDFVWGNGSSQNFSVTASLVYKEKTYDASGKGRTKKAAERDACLVLLNKLGQSVDTKIDDAAEIPSTNFCVPEIATNAKATLHEMKSKNLLSELYFTMKQTSKGFESTCVCVIMGDRLEISGPARPSKKAADQAASEMTYHTIKGTYDNRG